MEGLNASFEAHCNDLLQKQLLLEKASGDPAPQMGPSLQSLHLHRRVWNEGTALARGPGEMPPSWRGCAFPLPRLRPSVPPCPPQPPATPRETHLQKDAGECPSGPNAFLLMPSAVQH